MKEDPIQMKPVAYLLVACVLTFGLAAANLRRDSGDVEVDWRIVREPAKEVILERPARSPIVQRITAPGTIEPIEQAEIASQVVARVVAVPIQEGDTVRAGDLLVKLDDTDARAKLDSARARIERLRAAIDQSEADLEKALRD